MAERTPQSREELKLALHKTRGNVAVHGLALIEELDFVSKIKKSIAEHPILWGVGTVLGATTITSLLGKLWTGSKHRATPTYPPLLTAPHSSVHPPHNNTFKKAMAIGTSLAIPFAKRFITNYIHEKFSNYKK